MHIRIKAAAPALTLSLLCACATTPPPRDEPVDEEGVAEKMEEAPTDPFEDCELRPQQGVSVLECGNVVGVLATHPGALPEAEVNQNLEQFQAQFPPGAERERFTREIGEKSASGVRVVEESGGSPFRAELLVVPVAENETRIISCAVRGTTEFDRCNQMIEVLGTEGIPESVPRAEVPAPEAPEAAPESVPAP